MGKWSDTSTVLGVCIRWRLMASFTLQPLYNQYILDKRLGAPQSRSGRFREEKDLLPLAEIEPGLSSP
jgi:hypothetical protein